MKKFSRFLLAALAVMVVSTSPALSGDGIMVMKPWVRESPPNVQVLAAYMEIHNKGTKERILVGAASPAFSKVEIHETVMHEGMAMMEGRKEVKIAAGASVAMKPGGHHLMLISPLTSNRIMAGMTLPISLKFADGSRTTINVPVVRGSMGSSTPMNHNQHMNHMQHMNHN